MQGTGLSWFAYALTVFVVTPAQAPASEIVLHNFAFSPRGSGSDNGGVTADSASNLYGTTSRRRRSGLGCGVQAR